jgi:hypothetical protein
LKDFCNHRPFRPSRWPPLLEAQLTNPSCPCRPFFVHVVHVVHCPLRPSSIRAKARAGQEEKTISSTGPTLLRGANQESR